jgi:hypothetical protein
MADSLSIALNALNALKARGSLLAVLGEGAEVKGFTPMISSGDLSPLLGVSFAVI